MLLQSFTVAAQIRISDFKQSHTDGAAGHSIPGLPASWTRGMKMASYGYMYPHPRESLLWRTKSMGLYASGVSRFLLSPGVRTR